MLTPVFGQASSDVEQERAKAKEISEKLRGEENTVFALRKEIQALTAQVGSTCVCIYQIISRHL